ncbi:saccharopine dehydrogenase family protein [Halorarum salinum]|uniref:Saccharopine dehydrogenase NADP-binding domain-containing protein n=1 Tax=Halorarum salinum TaxID=2743089 RepID=A0A7D5QAF7_9EURY|nr:saccharopine dehydrogenase NADP-binding domain-containing protein [Halobaculum salinum]QLG61419.1 saccharopine dehydrogenase NADP-binding domain-containing protein [Halobaculum salinum]
MNGRVLVYGSYGYAGSLITREAVDAGDAPVLAGRRAEPLEEQATELGLDHRVFSLAHPGVVESQLGDVDAVLNCAGPFSRTVGPLLDACLETGTDYLDIAGRIETVESVAERDRDAERADVTVLPAVGFDVVPTDCLAATLDAELPETERLTLAIDGLGTFSPGTVKSIVESLDRPGAVREDGEIRSVPVAWKTREFDFGFGDETGVTVPWGTVSTAYYSTGIENVETYAVVPAVAVRAMRLGRRLTPLLAFEPLQRLLGMAADRFVSGPTPDERARSTARVWGEATTDDGDRAVARMTTPDTYDLTAATAVESARRVVSGGTEPGFQTPVTAFGADYVTEFDGVTLEHVEAA